MNMNSSSLSLSSGQSCKISMLWNWYTIDSCFISRSWHIKSKGSFAGSCVGVFFLVLASQWLHRFCREYDAALVQKHKNGLDKYNQEFYSDKIHLENTSNVIKSPLLYAFSHYWVIKPINSESKITLTMWEHVIRTTLFTLEWGLSYIIMLLFMYYNGYIIITCILGAFVGRLIFTYNESISGLMSNDAASESDESDRKCCR